MTDTPETSPEPNENIQMTTDIIASYVSNNAVTADELPALIRSVHTAMSDLSAPAATQIKQKPAVPISRSITEDYMICLEDGAKLKMLKRYLRTRYSLTPDEYRQKWRLPADYPMVAPSYARRRSTLAKEIGLGKGSRKAKG
ncbi:MAG: transcriptional regulator [Robiginitomaculum sp.]|nr:MAG: transcriptional regulator [Robiginitomaculum sp.]